VTGRHHLLPGEIVRSLVGLAGLAAYILGVLAGASMIVN